MKNNLFNTSAIALALSSLSSLALAETTAITNATVHTVTAQGVLTNATIIIENGKIKAINPKDISADNTIDAQGKIITPGLIGSMNQLGLVEVGAVSRTRDAREKKADITFDPSLAFNPKSTVVAYSRKGGVTSNVVTPSGGDNMFKGQAFVAKLSGDFDSVVLSEHAVIIDLGAKSKGSRATDLQKLTHKLEDAQKALSKAKKPADGKSKKDKADKKEPKRDAVVINALLKGDKPLLAYVERATDILALLDIKQRFNLDLVLIGAGDAVVVKEQLAKANVPVVINAMRNLPSSFDTLHTGLDNAATLTKAGVKVSFSINDAHNLYQMRFGAGNAVANGLSKEDALAAVTANVADAFNIDAGRIAVGKDADLVMWSADPFELSTKVEKIWIDGEALTTKSRQDALRNRYTTPSEMPRAYTK